MSLTPLSSTSGTPDYRSKLSPAPGARLRELLSPAPPHPLGLAAAPRTTVLGAYDRSGQVRSPFLSGQAQTVIDARTETTREEATALTLKTRDGDTVTITFLRDQWQRDSLSARQTTAAADASAEGDGSSSETVAQSTSAAGATLLSQLSEVRDGIANQSITFAASEAERSSGSYLHRDGDNATLMQFTQESGASVGFSFAVEGELDAEELKAIGELVQKVDGLAESFFAGNIYDALAQGKALGFNEDEIANFALKLEKTETQSVAVRYGEQARQGEQSRASLPDPLARRVAKHLDDLAAVEKLSADLMEASSVVTLLANLTDQREAAYPSRRDQFPDGPGALHGRMWGHAKARNRAAGASLPGSQS